MEIELILITTEESNLIKLAIQNLKIIVTSHNNQINSFEVIRGVGIRTVFTQFYLLVSNCIPTFLTPLRIGVITSFFKSRFKSKTHNQSGCLQMLLARSFGTYLLSWIRFPGRASLKIKWHQASTEAGYHYQLPLYNTSKIVPPSELVFRSDAV